MNLKCGVIIFEFECGARDGDVYVCVRTRDESDKRVLSDERVLDGERMLGDERC